MDQAEPTILADLFEQGVRLCVAKNNAVLRAEDKPQGIYYIRDGYIKAYALNQRGEEYVHIIHGPGEIFPITWLVMRTPRHIYYDSLTHSTLYRLEREQILARFRADYQYGWQLMIALIRQYQVYINRIDNLEYKYARERLVFRLLSLAARFADKVNGTYIIRIPITQQMIGSSVNLSRETVSREFDRLIAKGLVGYDNRRIVLKDIDALMGELPNQGLATQLGLR